MELNSSFKPLQSTYVFCFVRILHQFNFYNFLSVWKLFMDYKVAPLSWLAKFLKTMLNSTSLTCLSSQSFWFYFEQLISQYIGEHHKKFQAFVTFHLVMCRLIVITALVLQVRLISPHFTELKKLYYRWSNHNFISWKET